MATVNFRIKGKNDPTNILVRFKHGNKFDFEKSTEIQIKRRHWSAKKQQIKTVADAHYRIEINNHLNRLKAHILQTYAIDNSNGTPITSRWFAIILNKYFNRITRSNNDEKIFLTAFIESFIKISKNRVNPKTGKKLKPRTIQHYQTTLNKLIEYQTKNNINLRLNEINIPFHTNFIEFLQSKHNLNNNTIGGYIDDIKTFLNYADRKGYKIDKSYKDPDFYSPSNETFDIALTENEIKKITNTLFEKDSYLDNAKDWLLIGIWTGLRISDFLKLKKEDINDGFIHIKNYKTDIDVVIPVLETFQNILDKRNGELPRKISDQKLNKYIKEVCKIAGLNNKSKGGKMNPKTKRKEIGIFPRWQLVSSHTCRRTFATLHYGKIDTLTIMKITGHSTEKQFLDYIKITPREYAERLKNYYTQQKLEKEANLKVV